MSHSTPDKPPAGVPNGTLDDKPPFLSWPTVYVVVAGSLVVEIAVLAAVHWIYR